MTAAFTFPVQFVWGVATAATQIEGGATADGKGPSVWDEFATKPGRIRDGGTPAIACDHYHRYAADFALMRDLGVQHYRFSIAWTRLFPNGDGAANKAGFDFYHRLIDSMQAHNITPWGTLYHWDLPQALEDRGGWRDRDVVEAFGKYAEAAVKAFGDRIKHWFTLNEIPGFVGHGYKLGLHAPGATEAPQVVNQIYHHALLGHALAVQAVRSHGGAGAQVGLVHNPEITVPFTETAADVEAARSIFAQTNEHMLAPIYAKGYPSAYLARSGADAPIFTEEEMLMIAQPTDFLGLNVYRGHFVRAGADGFPELLPLPKSYPRCDAAWLHHVPQAMYWGLRFCRELYQVPQFYITENGAGYFDAPNMTANLETIHGWSNRGGTNTSGEIVDLHRCQYLRTYLQSLHRAIGEGLPVSGYFLWSFMDNFEWADGYTSRFGVYYVDYTTQCRIPKLSARWFSTVIRENRVV